MRRECYITIYIYLPMRFAHNSDGLEGDTPVNPKIITVLVFSSGAAIKELYTTS